MVSLFAGCSYYSYYIPTGNKVHKYINPEDIKLHSGDIKEEYEIIASVAATTLGDAETASKYLKEKAAYLGADNIIQVRITTNLPFFKRTDISGIAVRIK